MRKSKHATELNAPFQKQNTQNREERENKTKEKQSHAIISICRPADKASYCTFASVE
jgi:hypothetical protein